MLSPNSIATGKLKWGITPKSMNFGVIDSQKNVPRPMFRIWNRTRKQFTFHIIMSKNTDFSAECSQTDGLITPGEVIEIEGILTPFSSTKQTLPIVVVAECLLQRINVPSL